MRGHGLPSLVLLFSLTRVARTQGVKCALQVWKPDCEWHHFGHGITSGMDVPQLEQLALRLDLDLHSESVMQMGEDKNK